MVWRKTMSSEPSDSLGEDDKTLLPLQNEQESGRARKSLIYELFVLGELMDEPHHGYQLREILSNLLGPFRQISWGVLYPLIRQLELEGLLASDAETNAEDSGARASGSRQRKQYRLTETGRERFYTLMLERGDYNADYPELFTVKLNNMSLRTLAYRIISVLIFSAPLASNGAASRGKSNGLNSRSNV